MVKFGKNKLKALNKISKKQKLSNGVVSNKILKKKQNAEKKVTFQKEVLSKIDIANDPLVKNVEKVDLRALLNESSSKKQKKTLEPEQKPKKLKPVKSQKQRQKMQISDTKMLLNLMKKK